MSRSKQKAENQQLIRRLNRDGFRIAQQFGLRYRCIEAERANVKNRYGICYDDGTIRIRLRHVATGRPLKYSSLVDTLCHELAHLRYFDHSERFHVFYRQVLGWARRAGIYLPGDPTSPGKVQRPRALSPWELPPARSGPAFESDLLRARRAARGAPASAADDKSRLKPEQLSLF